MSRKSSQRREARLKTLGYVGLGVLSLATVGIVGSVAFAPAPQVPVSDQVQSYYENRTATPTPTASPTAPVGKLPAEAGALLWADTFNRADGEPGAAESGQTYLTHFTNNQRPIIVGGQLMSVPQDAASKGSGYVAVRLPEMPVHFVQRFTISGAGKGAPSAVSIVPGNGSTVKEIIDSDIHAIHTRESMSIQVRDAATNDYRTVNTWPVSINRDGVTEYEWSMTLVAPDTIRLVDARGNVRTSTDPRYAELWGPDVYIQAVDASQDKPIPGDTTGVTGIWAYAGK